MGICGRICIHPITANVNEYLTILNGIIIIPSVLSSIAYNKNAELLFIFAVKRINIPVLSFIRKLIILYTSPSAVFGETKSNGMAYMIMEILYFVSPETYFSSTKGKGFKVLVLFPPLHQHLFTMTKFHLIVY